MTLLNAMFRNGDNSLVNVQWEFLDTPPARSWRNMFEYVLENPKSNPLHLTDAVFCQSRDEAKALWDQVRTDLIGFNHIYAKMPFGKVKAAHCSKLLEELFQMQTNGMLGLDRTYVIKGVVDNLKKVMFYLDKVADTEFNNGNEGSAYGQINVIPDPHFAIEFKPEWIEYLTMDIEPGTMYAELVYTGQAWHHILQLGQVENAYDAIRTKRFGPPAAMGSGFVVPFNQDVGGVEAELIQYFYNHRGALKHLDSTFDPMYALACSGRLPVAKLKTSLGAIGYAGYEDLKRIKSLFKLEAYDD